MLDSSLYIPKNMFGCFPVHHLRFHHELTEGVDSVTNVWPSIDQIHQGPYKLYVQGWINVFIFLCVNLLLDVDHWSSLRSIVLHPKSLQDYCSISPLSKEDLTLLLPNFQPQEIMHLSQILHVEFCG